MIKNLELPESSDVKTHPGRRMSEAEFVEWCDDKTWAEWVDGEVTLMSPVSFEHDDLFTYMLRLIGMYVEYLEAGIALTEPMHIRFATQRRRRSPDIFFISESRREII